VSEALLEVDGLEAGYGDVVVLHGVSLRVAAGELVCIVGPNGAGKSTLLKAVYGLVRRSSGSIRLAGEEIGDERPDRLTRRGLNLVPQIDNVFPSLTVRENLKVGVLGAPKSERAAALERVHELFPLLRERSRQRAGTLSGGQRKLLELARLLMAEPRLVLLDEPLAGVHRVLGRELLSHIHELRAERGTTFFFIEHDMEVVMANADRVIVMAHGRVIAAGAPAQVRRDPAVIDAYLGTDAKDAV
jgi:ABC-type branched-subunit amino acid transport system ATPase component